MHSATGDGQFAEAELADVDHIRIAPRGGRDPRGDIAEYRRLVTQHRVVHDQIDIAQRALGELLLRELRIVERARVIVERLGGDDPFGIAAPQPPPRPAPAPRRRRQRGEIRRLLLAALPGTVSEIARKAGVDPGTTRTALRMMEQKGVIVRDEAPAGGRRRPMVYRGARPRK